MNINRTHIIALTTLMLFIPLISTAGPVSAAADSVGSLVISKFGRGVAGATAHEVSEATATVVARYGDDALPLLRSAGHQGFEALSSAGDKAPEVIKLYARRGDEALWVISDPKRLSIFIKHGDSAADALSKYPGIADDLIERFGSDAAVALNAISKQSAQHLAIVADEGLLTASARSADLLPVVRRYGDQAMDFIWKNKGALAVASVLGTFLADPDAYISGTKDVLVPAIGSVNWTLIVASVLAFMFLPKILISALRLKKTVRNKGEKACVKS